MEWDCLSPELYLAWFFFFGGGGLLDETLRYRIITDYICGANNIFVIYISIFFCDGNMTL